MVEGIGNGSLNMSVIYRIIYHGKAFGDNLFAAYLTRSLQMSGIDARLDNSLIAELVDCPLFVDDDSIQGKDVRDFNCERKNRTGKQTDKSFTVYSDLLKEFEIQHNIGGLKSTLDHVPVKFTLDHNAPSYDVAMVSKTGWWTPYRNWPFFDELKKRDIIIKKEID